jgi:tetratricopeptide (TPR) repeat protein
LKKLLFLPAVLFGLLSCQKKSPPVPQAANKDFQKAQSLIYKNNDSAFYYFNKVVAGTKDSLQIAMSYNQMAAIQSDAGDFIGSQESLLASLKFLDEKKESDLPSLASDYNELGMTSLNLKNYDAAISYYDRALKASRDTNLALIVMNNKALIYQKKGDYTTALRIYLEIFPKFKKNTVEYARALSNIARTKWFRDPRYKAALELLTALRIRQRENDLWGQNASFAHLADYYAAFRKDSALFYARKMDTVARRLNSPDDQLEAMQRLIRFGPAEKAGQYFTTYRRLDDSLQTTRAAAKNQFALIRYDAEKNKSDNLKLQKDNSEKKYQIARQYFLLGLAVLAMIVAIFWYRHILRANKLRTAKKIHDEIANGLYRVMSQLDSGEAVDKGILATELDILYQKSRNISYDHPRPDIQDFHEKIAGLVLSFGTEHTKVILVGNEAVFWQKTGAQTRQEIEQVLLELMVNMKKHSKAGNVVLKFEAEGDQLVINYRDDGVGLTAQHHPGNGMTNTGNRIKAVRGRITFDSETGKGLLVRICFPVI